MHHKKTAVRLSVGGLSILIIFVVLTLTTFAALSLVSARADNALSQKAMRAARQHYAADFIAEELLAHIAGVVENVPRDDDFISSANNLINSIDKDAWSINTFDCAIHNSREGAWLNVSYIVPINDIQELHVELIIHREIYRNVWKVVTDPGEEEQDGLNLWMPEDGGL